MTEYEIPNFGCKTCGAPALTANRPLSDLSNISNYWIRHKPGCEAAQVLLQHLHREKGLVEHKHVFADQPSPDSISQTRVSRAQESCHGEAPDPQINPIPPAIHD